MVLPEGKVRSPLEGLSISRFGGKTYIQENNFQTDGTVRVILPNNPNRCYWQLINNSAHDVMIRFDPGLAVSNGWLLSASGGVLSMNYEEDGEGAGYTVYGYTLDGTGITIRILETLRL